MAPSQLPLWLNSIHMNPAQMLVNYLTETEGTLKKLFEKIILLLQIKEEESCNNCSLKLTLTISKVIY